MPANSFPWQIFTYWSARCCLLDGFAHATRFGVSFLLESFPSECRKSISYRLRSHVRKLRNECSLLHVYFLAALFAQAMCAFLVLFELAHAIQMCTVSKGTIKMICLFARSTISHPNAFTHPILPLCEQRGDGGVCLFNLHMPTFFVEIATATYKVVQVFVRQFRSFSIEYLSHKIDQRSTPHHLCSLQNLDGHHPVHRPKFGLPLLHLLPDHSQFQHVRHELAVLQYIQHLGFAQHRQTHDGKFFVY
ncbi:unnamed protein product [Chondrus crispus]|uniref:Uncharacterized protein n=1 Tax=Chondrus crispus TaxID=2769 RepID=R7QPI3_CHOCR|nr:unnamed protein product [Chondrus crispus]CDF39688.1 unnamed protein product [Chondrus crispus]|eukprot:XP_005709982.1 unnamed protein product [Chondrus crispus]